jgi:hypothetical protein
MKELMEDVEEGDGDTFDGNRRYILYITQFTICRC